MQSLLLLLGFAASELPRARSPSSSRKAESGLQPKPLVTAKRQMVVAANPLAAEAGLAILRKGGSAVDAGIATQMVLNLVEPQSSGIGGGGFILYLGRRRASSSPASTAARPRPPPPRRSCSSMPTASRCRAMQAMASGLSVGVPGALAALKLAHDKYGKLPWAELFEPAIALAREGFAISPRLARLIADADPQSFTPDARAYFFDAQGRPLPAGYKLANPALADTFEAIARDGPDAFYKGDIATRHRRRGAERSAQARQAHGRGPRHLSRHRARAHLRALSRATRFAAWRPPSSGAVAVAQVLGIIEPFDLGPAPLGARAVHLIVEAERLALRRPRRAISPIPISSPFRSRACSIRPISPSAAR